MYRTNVTVTPINNQEWHKSLVGIKNAWFFIGTHKLTKISGSLRTGLEPLKTHLDGGDKRIVGYYVKVEMIFPSKQIKGQLGPMISNVDGRELIVATKSPFKIGSIGSIAWEGPFIEESYKSHKCRVTPVFPNDPDEIMDRELIVFYEGVFPRLLHMSEEDIINNIKFEGGEI